MHIYSIENLHLHRIENKLSVYIYTELVVNICLFLKMSLARLRVDMGHMRLNSSRNICLTSPPGNSILDSITQNVATLLREI